MRQCVVLFLSLNLINICQSLGQTNKHHFCHSLLNYLTRLFLCIGTLSIRKHSISISQQEGFFKITITTKVVLEAQWGICLVPQCRVCFVNKQSSFTKMSSFLSLSAQATPRTSYLSCGIPFPVQTPGIISGLASVVVWLWLSR